MCSRHKIACKKWINTFITVNNGFSVTRDASLVQIIGKSHHSWPRNRQSRSTHALSLICPTLYENIYSPRYLCLNDRLTDNLFVAEARLLRANWVIKLATDSLKPSAPSHQQVCFLLGSISESFSFSGTHLTSRLLAVTRHHRNAILFHAFSKQPSKWKIH